MRKKILGNFNPTLPFRFDNKLSYGEVENKIIKTVNDIIELIGNNELHETITGAIVRLTNEFADFESDMELLDTKINNEVINRVNRDNQIDTKLDNEIANRESSDSALQTSINQLNYNLNAEHLDRVRADDNLSETITNVIDGTIPVSFAYNCDDANTAVHDGAGNNIEAGINAVNTRVDSVSDKVDTFGGHFTQEFDTRPEGDCYFAFGLRASAGSVSDITIKLKNGLVLDTYSITGAGSSGGVIYNKATYLPAGASVGRAWTQTESDRDILIEMTTTGTRYSSEIKFYK